MKTEDLKKYWIITPLDPWPRPSRRDPRPQWPILVFALALAALLAWLTRP